jgi:hypothetical protein
MAAISHLDFMMYGAHTSTLISEAETAPLTESMNTFRQSENTEASSRLHPMVTQSDLMVDAKFTAVESITRFLPGTTTPPDPSVN